MDRDRCKVNDLNPMNVEHPERQILSKELSCTEKLGKSPTNT